MEKIKVLYIMGAGRSGSTILGIVLGNLKQYFFAGELHLWQQVQGVEMNNKPENIVFWNRVIENFDTKQEYLGTDFDKIEYHTALTPIFFGQRKNIVKKFHKQSRKLFDVIHQLSAKDIIVDSSHYPLRAYWLNKNPALDVSFIYLYRHPLSVIDSFRRKDVEQPQKSIFGANAYLFAVSLLSTIVYFFLPRSKKIRIRYEDLITDTDRTLHKIENLYNTKNAYPFNIKDISTGLIFRANRIRLKEKITLETTLKKDETKIFLKVLIYFIHCPFILLNPRDKKQI